MNNKNRICLMEFNRKSKLNDIWNTTHKYSNIFQKNIDKKNLHMIVVNSYMEYLNECKSNNHDTTTRLKNNRIWETLINTCYNPKNDMTTIRRATSVFIHSININLKNNNINRL